MVEHGVSGSVAAGYEPVRDEFAAVVAGEGGELGAQLAAYHHGRRVVDLWSGPDVTGDSLLGVYSVSKGLTHLVVALLVGEGVLDLDRTVAHYWPEFAAAGKRDVLLRELFSHQAGLVGADGGFTPDELADDRLVAERLAAQLPYWRPGAAFGYHALVLGALSSEVVRRATGRTVQELFAERMRDPYDLDVHLGLPDVQDHRFLPAQPVVATPERLAALAAAATAPNSVPGIAFNRHHPQNREVWELPTLRAVRARGTASFGGVGSARGLARAFAVTTQSVDGHEPLLTPQTAAAVAQIQAIGRDVVVRERKAFAVGFHPVSEVYPVLGQGAFGHSGAGGQQAFVDPRNGIAYAYLRRRFLFPARAVPENDRLIRAVVGAASRA